METQHESDFEDSRTSGGPRSVEGRSTSRSNAVKHGLTAKALLPEVLGEEIVRQAHDRLLEEWQPLQPLSGILCARWHAMKRPSSGPKRWRLLFFAVALAGHHESGSTRQVRMIHRMLS